MSGLDPLSKTKADYKELVAKIALPDSPVGIDAQYTHAIIITYLQQIEKRLSKLEAQLNQKNIIKSKSLKGGG